VLLPEQRSKLCRATVGTQEIPRNSPFAVTIPGAVDAWEQLLRDHGTRSLAAMLQPAIALRATVTR
jgi:gamma-glutamyltranspeptidase